MLQLRVHLMVAREILERLGSWLKKHGCKKESLNERSSVGKDAQWRQGGHGFNPIPQWHLVN